MKSIITFLFATLIFSATAQKVGINNPIPAMQLDVVSADSAALSLTNSQTFADSLKTALYFKTGNYYTGAIKTHVQSAGSQLARLGFFTFALANANGLKERMSILDNGSVGIGTVSPITKLDVAGNIRINDGTQGLNKILTSDATGVATWQNQSASHGAFRSSVASATGQSIPSSLSGSYTITFATPLYDDGATFDGVAFTAPATGLYHFEVSLYWALTSPAYNYPIITALKVGASFEFARNLTIVPGGSTNVSTSVSSDYKLNAGESVYVSCSQSSGATQNIIGNTISFFSAHRVY